MKVTASTTLTHNPWGEVYWASGLRENLTSRSYGEGLETGRRVLQAPRQSLTRQITIRDGNAFAGFGQDHCRKVERVVGANTLRLVLTAARTLSAILYGVPPWDPLALAGAAAVLTVTALGAGYFPARRAARLDPARTLASE